MRLELYDECGNYWDLGSIMEEAETKEIAEALEGTYRSIDDIVEIRNRLNKIIEDYKE